MASSIPSIRRGGLVLCGGQSRRMGVDKAWLPWGSQTLLQRVVEQVAGAVGPVVVVRGPGQSLPPLRTAVEIVEDDLVGAGPLAGLAVGLATLAERCDAVYVTGCDAPLLLPGWIDRLFDALGETEAAAPHWQGRWQPLAAVYRPRAVATIRRHLERGERRVIDLLAALEAKLVDAEMLRDVDPRLDSLRNVNRPEDYRALLVEQGWPLPDELARRWRLD